MSEPIYGSAAQQYWDAGWRGILPFAPGTKWPPPEGTTGHAGENPSYPDIFDWAENARSDWNIGLRLPRGIVGIDVDAYGDRTGAATLIEAEKRWGPLPPTVRSTSRTDSVSGIRLYRIPEGVQLRDRIKFPEMKIGHTEIVQYHHRYVICWPSRHPEGGTYLWLDENGAETNLPSPDEIPELPQSWVDALRSDSAEITTIADVDNALERLPSGPMSVKVERMMDQAIRELEGDADSRHEATRTNVGRLLRLGDNFEPGVPTALANLRSAFIAAVGHDRPGAAGEFDRMLKGQRIHDLIASTPDTNLHRLAGESERKPEPRQDLDDVVRELDITEEEESEELEPMSHADRWLMSGEIQESEYEPPEDDPDVFAVRSVPDLANIVPAEPMIDGLLYQNTLVQISGNPGSFKTFLVLSMACAVASRQKIMHWSGYPVKAHGTVLYIAAEGLSGLRARILAWCEENGHAEADLDLLLLDHPVQLASRLEMQKLVNTVVRHSAKMVVFDTRARCSIGLEENSATEQGDAIAAAEQLREATDCTVVMIHHSAKSGNGGRGSNAWDGAVWSDLRVASEGMKTTIHCEKHKDVPSGCDHEFEVVRKQVSAEVMPGVDPFTRNTLVVRSFSNSGPGKTSGAETETLRIFQRAAGKTMPISRAQAVELSEGKPSKSGIYNSIRVLVNKGLLIQHGTGNRCTFTVAESVPED